MPKALGMGGASPMTQPQPAPAQNGGGFFGPRGSQQRYDLTMQMISQAMNSAQGTNSPVLAFLAPLASAAIGARATKLREDEKAKNVSAMTESILGPNGMSPRAKSALEVMNNPDAPDYLESIAESMFKAEMKPQQASSGGGGGGKRRTTPAAAKKRIYGEYTIDGYLYGRDATGQMVPYTDAAGNKVAGKGGAPASPASPAAAPAAPLVPPPDPVLPADPTTPDNDPLGIR